MAVFFTSDTHFGHDNIISFCDRPFDDATDMDAALVASISSTVSAQDILYVLGDFAMGRNINKVEHARNILEKLNCQDIRLVLGNHDVKDEELLRSIGFSSVEQYAEISVDGNKFVLMHYPLLEWNGFYKGWYHLHGHVHNKPEYNIAQRAAGVRRFDVGMDANYYRPVSAQEIVRFFEQA